MAMPTRSLLQLHRAHEGQDHADQQRDQSDDRQGIGPAVLDDQDEVGAAEAGLAPEVAAEGLGRFAQKSQHFAKGFDQFERLFA
jgi:hypothetical protein